MTASVKTTNQAFVLNQKNSEAFLKQDNASFKNLMAKFEKFTTKSLESYAKDGRLTEPSDGKIFDYRKMFELVKKLGRPLTDKEAEQFRIK